MSNIDFYPLGSIVIMRGGIRKTMIIARGVAAEIGNEVKYFDYAGCIYPEGLIMDQMMYFNHEDIAKEVFCGYSDEEDKMMVENINTWEQNCGYAKGNPYEINMQKSES